MQIEVQIGRMATTLKRLVLPEGTTLRDALEAAQEELNIGLKPAEEPVVNGDSIDYDDELQNGDTIVFVQSVAGA